MSFNFVQSQQFLLQENLLKINIITPAVSFEKKLSEKNSLVIETGLSAGFNIRANETTYLFSPYILGQYRNYYNLIKRQKKNKSIAGNSGSFLAAHTSYYLLPLNNNKDFVSTFDGLTIGVIWGFQKTYKVGLNLGANAGLGYNFSDNKEKGVLPIVNFSLGWLVF